MRRRVPVAKRNFIDVSRRRLLRRASHLAAFYLGGPVVGAIGTQLAQTSPTNTYYVSAEGRDGDDGKSPGTAWASIKRANDSLPADKSRLLFRRGDTFYGELAPPRGCEIGAYGFGAKPTLTMFKILNRPEAWSQYQNGVWSIELGVPGTHGGYVETLDANIGYLQTDGVVRPSRKDSLDGLLSEWDFYCDIPGRTLYVKANMNPARIADDIKAAPHGDRRHVIVCDNGLNSIRDLHVTGTGGCGIGGVGAGVLIRDCLIDYIGGSELRDGSNRRYGNGIQCWVGADDWLIENNEIANVYDAAWTAQGPAEDSGYWRDITFRGNYLHHCSQMIEFWSTGGGGAPGFERIRVQDNRCVQAGYSVFSEVRPDQAARVHLLTYNMHTPADIVVEGNTFDGAYGAYAYHASRVPAGLISRRNVIRLRPGQKLQAQLPLTIEQAAMWQARTGAERGSVFELA